MVRKRGTTAELRPECDDPMLCWLRALLRFSCREALYPFPFSPSLFCRCLCRRRAIEHPLFCAQF